MFGTVFGCAGTHVVFLFLFRFAISDANLPAIKRPATLTRVSRAGVFPLTRSTLPWPSGPRHPTPPAGRYTRNPRITHNQLRPPLPVQHHAARPR